MVKLRDPFRRRILVASIALLVFLLSSFALSCGSPSFSKDVTDRLNAAFDKGAAAAGSPGIAAGVWVDGNGSWVKSAGKADMKTGQTYLPQDRFRIASITKTFTGTLVLMLVDEGKLTLEDPINKYVAGIPSGEKITMRMLLNHSSGIYDCDDDDAFFQEVLTHPLKQWTPRQVVDVALKHPPYFPPGQGYHYSNTDSILLGMVIEKVTGRKVEALFKTEIFDKLGLKDTLFPTGPRIPGLHAHGYSGEPGKFEDVTLMNMSWDWTAGGVVSNLYDLKAWAKELTDPQLISAAMQQERLQLVGVAESPTGVATGYGLAISKIGDYLGHTGADPGWTSLTYRWQEKGVTVVVLMNSENNDTINNVGVIFKNLANTVEPSSFPE